METGGTELSATAYVILGLVRERPRSGYEIKAAVDTSTRFFWAASYGQIYPELRRLAEAGLIAGSEAPTGGRRRTVYEITADGEAELRAWLRRPPRTFELRDEGLLKLFFAGALPREEAAAILREMRAYRLQMLRSLHEIEPHARALDDPYPLLVLRSGIEFASWFADWCRRAEEEVLAGLPAPAGRDRGEGR